MAGLGIRAEAAAGVVSLAFSMAVGRMRLGHVTLGQRLAAFPRHHAPVSAPVAIRWDEHQVPMIEARSDQDAAVALGVVHAHLRLGQMEVMRRIVSGRVAEMLGPVALPLDHALRILDLGRAAPAMIAMMPPATRQWLHGFTAGINHLLARLPADPPDFRVLGLAREPWRLADVVAVGRLACADPNWLIWFNLLRLEERPDWPQLWQRLQAEQEAAMPPLPDLSEGLLAAVATAATRAGSNAVAVAGWRSTSGAALMAADPHLNLLLPNLWLLAGVRCPSLHAVGMMLPGLPFLALGRNRDIAWSGTSAQAALSDFIDLEPEAAVDERQERLNCRWGKPRQVTCRDSALGPVISDSALARRRRPTALRWMGHRASDEFSAMLALNRCRDWAGFVAALDGMAVPGQFMLYADRRGNIGSAVAARLPARPSVRPQTVTVASGGEDHWRKVMTASRLPTSYNPADGLLASANEQPDASPVPVSFFWPPRDRHSRMRERLTRRCRVGVEDLSALQRDVFSETSVALRDAFAPHLTALRLGARGEVRRLADAVLQWDGNYHEDSPGAAAFEALQYHFALQLHGTEFLPVCWATWDPQSLLHRELTALDRPQARRTLAEALGPASRAWARCPRWGDMHRLMLGHPLSFVPLLGRLYRFADLPVGGANQTLMKSAHGLDGSRHAARFGAQARMVCDMADPDRNWFVLLGGQDGWMGSDTFLDQLPLWRQGRYLRLPLSPDAVLAAFPHRTDLVPHAPPPRRSSPR